MPRDSYIRYRYEDHFIGPNGHRLSKLALDGKTDAELCSLTGFPHPKGSHKWRRWLGQNPATGKPIKIKPERGRFYKTNRRAKP
jgi:hypothetical protein